MPEVFESAEITGTVSASGAEETGLRVGIPIVAGAGDNAAGAVGMGIVSGRNGKRHYRYIRRDISSSQSSQDFDPNGRIHTLCHAVPGRWQTRA